MAGGAGVNQSADVNKEIVHAASGQFNYNKPQINADERRFVAITHRKGREERKAEQQISLRTPRRRTRMTRIGRIFTDDLIRAHPCHLCNPCSIAFESFSSIPQQEAAQ
jgi:hypothetical protein